MNTLSTAFIPFPKSACTPDHIYVPPFPLND
jgi:hypothetical protein